METHHKIDAEYLCNDNKRNIEDTEINKYEEKREDLNVSRTTELREVNYCERELSDSDIDSEMDTDNDNDFLFDDRETNNEGTAINEQNFETEFCEDKSDTESTEVYYSSEPFAESEKAVIQEIDAHCFGNDAEVNELEDSETNSKLKNNDIIKDNESTMFNIRQNAHIISEFRPYYCEICGKTFKHKANLRKHGKIHTGDKPFKCGLCDKAFFVTNDIERHMRIHSGDKPFECSLCNKTFNQNSNLRKHLLVHTGERPHECDVCGKTFNNSSNLLRHARIHNQIKPYKCDVCGKDFSQNGNLQKHLRRMHASEQLT